MRAYYCRYTGPFYLAMAAPTAALGSGLIPETPYAWVILALIILVGSKLLWWASEQAWGRFS